MTGDLDFDRLVDQMPQAPTCSLCGNIRSQGWPVEVFRKPAGRLPDVFVCAGCGTSYLGTLIQLVLDQRGPGTRQFIYKDTILESDEYPVYWSVMDHDYRP